MVVILLGILLAMPTHPVVVGVDPVVAEAALVVELAVELAVEEEEVAVVVGPVVGMDLGLEPLVLIVEAEAEVVVVVGEVEESPLAVLVVVVVVVMVQGVEVIAVGLSCPRYLTYNTTGMVTGVR